MTRLEYELREMKTYLYKWAMMSPPIVRNFLNKFTDGDLIGFIIHEKCPFGFKCPDTNELMDINCIRCFLKEEEGDEHDAP